LVAVISLSLEDSACGYYKHKARFKIRLRMVLFCIIVLILNVGCLAKVLAHAVPRSLGSSDPQFLNSSIPQFLNSSFPPFLSSSLRQFTNSSIPEVLNSLVHHGGGSVLRVWVCVYVSGSGSVLRVWVCVYVIVVGVFYVFEFVYM
jgi:hypothetical protein